MLNLCKIVNCMKKPKKTRLSVGFFIWKTRVFLGGFFGWVFGFANPAQNKAARTVTRLGFYTSADTLLKQCGWLSVSQLAFYHTVVLLFKVRKNHQPRYLFEMTASAENSRYGARSNQAGKLRVNGQMPKQTINCNSFK